MVADTESPPHAGPVATIVERLQRVKSIPGGYLASCPVPSHGKGKGDRRPSLSISEGDDGRALVSCHAGCTTYDVLSAIGLKPADLFPASGTTSGRLKMRKRREPAPPPDPKPDPHTSTDDDGGISPDSTSTHQHSGLTVENYAESKGFTVDVLRCNGCATRQHPTHGTCVAIPYLDESGNELTTRYRLGMTGDKFRWKAGTKAKGLLYGAQHLPRFRDAGAGYVAIVEGESDCHAAWHHDVPAVGIPGAAMWDEANAARLDGLERVYIVIEPDNGGEAVKEWLAGSAIRDRAYLVTLAPYKDLSELHASGNDFEAAWTQAMATATRWADAEQEDERAARYDAWERCATLATLASILDAAADTLEAAGVVGERRNLKLLYLILSSRFLPRPVNASIKGASSSGKSYQLESVLRLYPPDAYYATHCPACPSARWCTTMSRYGIGTSSSMKRPA